MYESEEEIAMPWIYNDAGYSGRTTRRGRHIPGNGVVRAIAIATERNYWEVHTELYRRQCDYVNRSRSRRIQDKGASIDEVGVWPDVSKRYLFDLGWTWVPVMKVGSGVTMHLSYDELPDEPKLIVRLSKALVTVIAGTVYDIHDPSRDGSRAVYGFFTNP